jgi:hypothetical protein
VTIADSANIAQLVIATATVISVVAALLATRRTLREVQHDRRLRQAPFLAFEPGGWLVPVKFSETGLAIPGVDREYVRKVFKDLPTPVRTVQIRDEPDKPLISYGRLLNAGSGPALTVQIHWIPDEVSIGRDRFRVDSEKLKEPVYGSDLNTMPVEPMMVSPGANSQLTRLPSFIVMDVEQKLTEVLGVLIISCIDISGETYEVRQRFRLATDYQNKEPGVYVTFNDVESFLSPEPGIRKSKLQLNRVRRP